MDEMLHRQAQEADRRNQAAHRDAVLQIEESDYQIKLAQHEEVGIKLRKERLQLTKARAEARLADMTLAPAAANAGEQLLPMDEDK